MGVSSGRGRPSCVGGASERRETGKRQEGEGAHGYGGEVRPGAGGVGRVVASAAEEERALVPAQDALERVAERRK